MATFNCSTDLHGGKQIPADWFVQELVKADPAQDDHDTRYRVNPMGAAWSACNDHLSHALAELTASHPDRRLTLRRVTP